MANYEINVKLPSGGKPYANTCPALMGDVTLCMLTAGKEMKILGGNNPNPLDYVLQECIVKPKFDIGILTPEDKHFLLMKIRIFSYGDDYHTIVQCTNDSCGYKGEVKFSLDEVEVKDLEGEYINVFDITLPITKQKMKVKVLDNGDYANIRKRVRSLAEKSQIANESELEYIVRMAMSVVEIEGVPVMEAQVEAIIQDLPVRDAHMIEDIQDKYDYGYRGYVKTKCPKCGGDVYGMVEMTSEFFRPRYS